jgi:aminoglycoside phosphotransferase family enzyme/predicted kinase
LIRVKARRGLGKDLAARPDVGWNAGGIIRSAAVPDACAQSQTAATQDEAVAVLANPATHGGARVTRLETHGNLIFLAGDDAWKIKRAVRFPYMDFSTLERRHAACEAELAVNRAFAPDLYLGVVPLTREADGHLALGGKGAAVEWAVHMRRFGQDDLLSAYAEAGRLTDAQAKAVADCVVESHRRAVPCDPATLAATSGHARIARVLEPVIATLATTALAPATVTSWADAARARLEAVAALLDSRARSGAVRRCHGDLHAANIVFWRGTPMLYDAIEFDPEIATVDTLYDLAFLVMDLGVRGATRAANVILNRYLWRMQDLRDIDGLAALPLFMSLRAGIRSMVTAERAEQEEASRRGQDLAVAARLLAHAVELLSPPPARLLAIAGRSGTGKSTLAARLAPETGGAPGAVHLRTDLIRKALAGVGEMQRLPQSAYTAEASRRVYDETMRQARHALAAGASVIVDAVAAHAAEREAIANLAQEQGAEFLGLWLTGPADVLAARVDARVGDASDATADVVRTQANWDTGPLEKGWSAINAAGSIDDTYIRARAVLDTRREFTAS